MTIRKLSRLQGTAIAAVLVLGSTPVLAQEAVPAPSAPSPIVLPPTITAAPAPEAAAPAPVAPTVAPEAPEAAPPAAVSAPAEPRRAAPPARTTARAASAAPAAAAPVAAASEPAAPVADLPVASDVAEPAGAAIAPAVPAETTADVAPPQDDAGSEALWGAGLLAALGLGGLALFLRRRRRHSFEPAEELVPMPARGTNSQGVNVREPIVVPQAATAPATPARAAVPLPATVPASQLERRALIARMVDAEPDEANPFRTRKARMKRARMILAKREQELAAMQTPATAPQSAAPRVRTFEPA